MPHKFSQSPKQLYLFYSTLRDLSNDTCPSELYDVFDIEYMAQITLHYLEELIKVAMHCKGQTVSFQMTSILI